MYLAVVKCTPLWRIQRVVAVRPIVALAPTRVQKLPVLTMSLSSRRFCTLSRLPCASTETINACTSCTDKEVIMSIQGEHACRRPRVYCKPIYTVWRHARTHGAPPFVVFHLTYPTPRSCDVSCAMRERGSVLAFRDGRAATGPGGLGTDRTAAIECQ